MKDVFQRPNRNPGIPGDVTLGILDSVQLFQHGDGNHHVVFVEIEDCGRVVNEYVGVENIENRLRSRDLIG